VGKSKRNTPKPDSNRAQRLAERRAAQEHTAAQVARPFEGMAVECDLVALRDFVPSATAPLSLPAGKRQTLLVTVLPGAVAALVRDGDEAVAYVAAQTQFQSGDPAADLAAAITWSQTAAPGDSLPTAQPDADTPALREVLDPAVLPEITVHDNFDWWVPAGASVNPQAAMGISQANAAIMPSARLALPNAAGAAWWVDTGERAHVRWVRPESEDDLMTALARLHAAGGLTRGDGSRFAGSFRTHGLLVPVFDLDRERAAAEWVEAAAEFDARLAAAISDTPLTSDERRSRDGLRSRQITLR
jgi:hypothetical protein